jgi:hypothetical protein
MPLSIELFITRLRKEREKEREREKGRARAREKERKIENQPCLTDPTNRPGQPKE